MKRLFALLIILALFPLSAQSTVRDCEELAKQIGQDAGLPQHLLPAIARIESGRSLNGKRKAWPWALNHAGKGLYFEKKSSALDYLTTTTAKGRTNIDVGCMQINHYWHGQEFKSLEQMIDPVQNVTYAAKFLRQLYKQHGSWADAVQHYHSPDENRGKRYFSGFTTAVETMNSTASNSIPNLAIAPTHYEFFNLGTAGQNKVDMGFQLASKANVYAQARTVIHPEYARLIASLGQSEESSALIMPPSLNDMTKSHQVRGVLRKHWSKVEALRKSLAVN